MASLKGLWQGEYARLYSLVLPNVDAHPLLIAVHFLRPDIVEVSATACRGFCFQSQAGDDDASSNTVANWQQWNFGKVLHRIRPILCIPPRDLFIPQFLLENGMNPDQIGTVASYPGDGMMASELQGISPLELSEKLMFVHGRRGKKGKIVAAMRKMLSQAAEKVS